MQSDALQHIDQAGVRVDALQAAGHHEALQDTQLLSAQFGPTKQVILSPHGHNPQSAFQMVGIHRHMGITEYLAAYGTGWNSPPPSFMDRKSCRRACAGMTTKRQTQTDNLIALIPASLFINDGSGYAGLRPSNRRRFPAPPRRLPYCSFRLFW